MDWIHRLRRHDRTASIPTELFFPVFQPLSFDDLLAASHVSRRWRAAALQFAHLWSDVRLHRQVSDPASLLGAVLPRAGALPIALEYVDIDGTQAWSARLGDILAAYLPRITHLAWSGPIACHLPEMANLVRLCVTVPPECHDYLPCLFDMFPSLEHLSLNGLTTQTYPLLPACPAPRSLVRLDLQTSDMTCDTIPLLARWRTSQLRTVRFAFALPYSGHRFGADMTPLLAGAVDLSVEHAYRSMHARITACNEAGFETGVEFHWPHERGSGWPATRWFARLLGRQRHALSSTLRGLRIPLQVLFSYLYRFHFAVSPLVHLNSLCVVVRCVHWVKVGFLRIPWPAMECLAHLSHLDALETLTFELVNLPSRTEELTWFVLHIVRVCKRNHRSGPPFLEITIRGIPEALVLAHDLSKVAGVSLTFVE